MKLIFLFFTFAIIFLGEILALDSLHSRQDWNILETKYTRIIFPKETKLEALKLSSYFRNSLSLSNHALKVKPRRFTIVINNITAVGNGFATLIPLYSELFSFPNNLGTASDWLPLLAIHEGHHLIQFEKLKQGNKKIWFIVGGGFGLGIMSMLYLPIWFFEGNATVQESLYSHSGRGQHPIFTLSLRAKELYGKRSSYYETYLKHSLLPLNQNQYDLGYILSSYLQFKYSNIIWSRILNSLNHYLIYPNFNLSLKKNTGLDIEDLYNASLDFYQKRWKKKIEGLPIDSNLKVLVSAEDRENWNAFLSPQYLEDGTLLSLSWGNTHRSELIQVDPFSKPTSLVPLIQMPVALSSTASSSAKQVLSVGGLRVAWIDKEPHLYEKNKSFSNLWIYDFEKDLKIKMSESSRYVASSISPNGKVLVAFYKGYDGQGALHFYDVDSLKQIDKIALPFGWNIYDLNWSKDQNKIVFTCIFDNEGISLKEYDIDKKRFVDLISASKGFAIRTPMYWNDYLIFQSDISGLDQIHAMHLVTKDWYQLTYRSLGAYFPTVNPKTQDLVFSDYGINGFSLITLPLQEENWDVFEIATKPFREKNFVLKSIVQSDSNTILLSKDTLDLDYSIEEYTSFYHLLNLHSWFLYYDVFQHKFMLSLFLKDYLTTTETNLDYFISKSKHYFQGSVLYTDYFLNLFVSAFTGIDQFKFVNFGVTLPLDFSQDQIIDHTLSVSPSIIVKQHSNSIFKNTTNWSWIRGKRTVLSPYPIGMSISHELEYELKKSDLKYTDFHFKLFLPGFTSLQGIKLIACSSSEDVLNSCLGRSSIQETTEKDYLVSFNYALNQFYMNWNISSLIYFKKVNLELFSEYAFFDFKDQNRNSKRLIVGGESNFLFHLFSSTFPTQVSFSLGFNFLDGNKIITDFDYKQLFANVRFKKDY